MVWFAHAKRDYGTERAAAARAAIAALWPGCEIVDPEHLPWGPAIVDRHLPSCGAVAHLPREPMALGVREELRRAGELGIPVVDLGPLLAMPEKVAGKLPVAKMARLPRAVTPIHQDKYGYTFGIWWDETTPILGGGWMYGNYWLFHPIGSGATYSLRISQVEGGPARYEDSIHVDRLSSDQGAITALGVPGGFYELTVSFDNPEYPGNTEEGGIGDVPVVHDWWPGA